MYACIIMNKAIQVSGNIWDFKSNNFQANHLGLVFVAFIVFSHLSSSRIGEWFEMSLSNVGCILMHIEHKGWHQWKNKNEKVI